MNPASTRFGLLPQILLLTLGPLLLTCALALWQVNALLARADRSIQAQLQTRKTDIQRRLHRSQDMVKRTAEILASSETVILGMNTSDADLLFGQGRLFVGSDIDYLAFLTTKGTVLARGHNEMAFGDALEVVPALAQAMAGVPFLGVTRLDSKYMVAAIVPLRGYDKRNVGYVAIGSTLDKTFLPNLDETLDQRTVVERNHERVAGATQDLDTRGWDAISYDYAQDKAETYTFTSLVNNTTQRNSLLDLRKAISIYTSLFFGLMFFGIVFFVRRLVRPVVSLAQAMDGYIHESKIDFRLDAPAGEVGELVTTFTRMVTELETKKRSLVQAEKKYRSIFENAVEGLYQRTPEGTYVTANPVLAAIYGFESLEAFMEQQSLVLDCYLDQEARAAFSRQLEAKGEALNHEFQLHRPDDRLVWIKESARVSVSDSGQTLFEGVVEDITARKRRDQMQLEREIAIAASEAKSVFLDNSGQGFLSFGLDLRIQDEYSRECERLLGPGLAGKNIAAAFHPQDPEAERQFAANLHLILHCEDGFKRDLLISLMPKEMELSGLHVRVEYSLVSRYTLMLVLTDLTREKRLQEEVGKERDRLKLVVSAVRDRMPLSELLQDFENVRQGLAAMVGEVPTISAAALEELYRRVHTYKGLFSQFDFIHLPEALHEFESDIAQTRNAAIQNASFSLPLERHLLRCDQAFNMDMATINEALGEAFLRKETGVVLSAELAGELKELMGALLHVEAPFVPRSEAKRLAEALQRVQRVSILDMLRTYPKYALKLADRQEKLLDEFVVTGPDVYVNPERFGAFAQSLVHVFRNAVDHGVELPEERSFAGKEETASISCTVGQDMGALTIRIEDDGAGLDTEAIRARGLAMGLFTAEHAAGLEGDALFSVIFASGFSTREKTTELSGRGMGLSAVKSELDALGGTVHITTMRGKGSCLVFRIPNPSV